MSTQGDSMKKPKPSRTGIKFIAAAITWNIALVGGALTSAAYGEGSTFAELQRLPVHKSDRDEAPEDRQRRLREIAAAIDAASQERLERAMLIELGHRESHFARDVCAGERLGDRDRAHGCWQAWTKVEERGGVDVQAEIAIGHLRRGGNYCAARGFDRIEGSYAIYGTGSVCSAPFARERAERAIALAGRL